MSDEKATVSQLQQQPHVLKSAAAQEEAGKVIDIHAALSRMGHDRSLLEDVGRFFLEDAPSMLAQLRAAVDRGSSQDVGQIAHSLKGLVSNFDAIRAFKVAFEVEQHGWGGRIDAARAQLDELDRELNRVIVAVRAEILPGH